MTVPVLLPNAVVNPGTVVIKFIDTLIALAAVFGPGWSYCLTGVAHVVNRVIQVLVVRPGSRVANLYSAIPMLSSPLSFLGVWGGGGEVGEWGEEGLHILV